MENLKEKRFKTFAIDPSQSQNVPITNETGINQDEIDLEKGYDYLLSMRLWNLTIEKVKELTDQRNKKLEDLEKLKARSVESIWLEDLNKLEDTLNLLFPRQFDSLPAKSATQSSLSDSNSNSTAKPSVKQKPPVKNSTNQYFYDSLDTRNTPKTSAKESSPQKTANLGVEDGNASPSLFWSKRKRSVSEANRPAPSMVEIDDVIDLTASASPAKKPRTASKPQLKSTKKAEAAKTEKKRPTPRKRKSRVILSDSEASFSDEDSDSDYSE